MYFGFVLELSDIDLLNIDLLGAHLDLSSRRLQDVFSVTIFRLPRRLQDVLEEVKLLR